MSDGFDLHARRSLTPLVLALALAGSTQLSLLPMALSDFLPQLEWLGRAPCLKKYGQSSERCLVSLHACSHSPEYPCTLSSSLLTTHQEMASD